jgi:hypothetical protein
MICLAIAFLWWSSLNSLELYIYNFHPTWKCSTSVIWLFFFHYVLSFPFGDSKYTYIKLLILSHRFLFLFTLSLSLSLFSFSSLLIFFQCYAPLCIISMVMSSLWLISFSIIFKLLLLVCSVFFISELSFAYSEIWFWSVFIFPKHLFNIFYLLSSLYDQEMIKITVFMPLSTNSIIFKLASVDWFHSSL